MRAQRVTDHAREGCGSLTCSVVGTRIAPPLLVQSSPLACVSAHHCSSLLPKWCWGTCRVKVCVVR